MIRNNDIDIDKFIQIKSGGISIADFTQVRDALINRYKLAYGSDIDLSTGTADGLFINDMALIINNILQSYKTLYSNLNVNTANGEYLDNLCALSNITRKPASNSIANVIVTNNGVNTWKSSALPFVDKNGVEWDYNESLTLAPGASAPIQLVCSELGPIEAPAGWITQTLEVTDLTVNQGDAAIPGENTESDSQLRERRASSSGSAGITVLESLIGSLLNVSGIKDVYLYENTSGSSTPALDGTTILGHSVYIVLRYREGITIDKKTIGSIIYEKMTPGITTSQANESIGGLSYEYIPNYLGIEIYRFSNMIYWKKAIPVHPSISIKIKPLNNFSTTQLRKIGDTVMKYANDLRIGRNLEKTNLLVEIAGTDGLFLGRPTFSTGEITIDGAVNGVYINQCTYYNYTNIAINEQLDKNGEYTITLS